LYASLNISRVGGQAKVGVRDVPCGTYRGQRNSERAFVWKPAGTELPIGIQSLTVMLLVRSFDVCLSISANLFLPIKSSKYNLQSSKLS
jgi:hypothetical protein